MKKLFIGVWHPSVILTYLGVCFAVFGIIMLSVHPDWAVICLACAAVCDMFDGMVARCFDRTDTEKQFGIQIDSLADIGSFVVFPACMLVQMSNRSIAAFIVAALFVVAGVARLAWFNITTEDAPECFTGLPVTSSALIVPVVYVVLSVISVSLLTAQIVWCVVFGLMAVLFVSNFRLCKPKMLFKILMLLAAIVLAALLLVII